MVVLLAREDSLVDLSKLPLELVKSSPDFSMLAFDEKADVFMLLPQQWEDLVLQLLPRFMRMSLSGYGDRLCLDVRGSLFDELFQCVVLNVICPKSLSVRGDWGLCTTLTVCPLRD